MNIGGPLMGDLSALWFDAEWLPGTGPEIASLPLIPSLSAFRESVPVLVATVEIGILGGKNEDESRAPSGFVLIMSNVSICDRNDSVLGKNADRGELQWKSVNLKEKYYK